MTSICLGPEILTDSQITNRGASGDAYLRLPLGLTPFQPSGSRLIPNITSLGNHARQSLFHQLVLASEIPLVSVHLSGDAEFETLLRIDHQNRSFDYEMRVIAVSRYQS
jgi:hypothetical protein